MQAFAWLAREALADAFRRRIVPAICVLALLSLFFVDNCTGCAAVVTQDGQPTGIPFAAAGGLAVMVLLALWTVVLAGVLASDHLAEPLADGSADLLLARPVSRGIYALARLAGAWALAGITGAGLLLATALLLQARQGLPPGPALAAVGICLVNAATVAALAMALSLALGRTLTALAVFAFVWGLAGAELAQLFPVEIAGWVRVVVGVGPPLTAGTIVPLEAWLGPEVQFDATALTVGARALVWAIASAGLLVLAFRRRELGR